VAVRFELVHTAFGSGIAATLGEVGVAQLLVCAAQDECDSVASWCAHWAGQLDDDPELIGVEIWRVLIDGAPRFDLLYTPWADAGTLFVAGTATETGLVLWPDGFKPHDRPVPAIDAGALTAAFAARG
jgi:hypothetical protein